MNREFLKALGLEDEAIDKIMAEHGKTLNDTKNKLDTVTTEKDELQSQLNDRDEQLNALKDVDPDKLKQEIADLQEANNNAKTEYESKLKDLQLTNAIKLAINGKVHDEDVATTLIDKEKLVISDDGKVVGLDEQLEQLQESKAYLFKQEPQNEPKPNFTTGSHVKGSNALTKEQIMQETDDTKRQQLIRENNHLFK